MVLPMKIELTENARPPRVRLSNYSQDQKIFLKSFVADLVNSGMAYLNKDLSMVICTSAGTKTGPREIQIHCRLTPGQQFHGQESSTNA